MMAWGRWRPDQAGPNTGIADIADGCIVQSTGYGPFPQFSTASGAAALAGAPRGIISLQKQDGTWLVFAASAAKIQLLSSTYTWSDIETGRTVTTGDDVSFAYFGKYLLNTDTTDGYKAYDVEAGGSNTAVSGGPAARYLFVCNNVVFLLGTSSNPRRWQSTGVGDHTALTTKGADGKTAEDGGSLVAGGDLKNRLGIIVQDKAVRAIEFGAGAASYSVSKVSDGRGCVHARTFVAFDGTAYWWDTDGPWMFSAADGLVPIGAEKINRWAEANIGGANFANLQATVDPGRNLVLWRIDATRLLAYNWLLKDFTTLPAVTSALTRLATPGVTIDGLPGTIDSLDSIIDNRLWAGAAPILGGLDASYKFATFSGAAMAGTVRNCLQNSPATGLIRWATPISDSASSTLSIGTSDNLAVTPVFEAAESKIADGRVPLRARGKNIQFEENFPAGDVWTYANGVDHIDGAQGGPS